MIVKMYIYGLKSSGAALGDKLAQVLYDMNYKTSREDPDVWIKSAVKVNGFKYYEYILFYFDNVLCISHVPLKKIDGIKSVFKLKGDRAEPPKMYLGTVLQKVTNYYDTEFWTMLSEKYLDATIKNVE